MEKEGKRRLVKTKYDYNASSHDEVSYIQMYLLLQCPICK